ncbi:MAG: metallophosphoesterase [Thermoprotei archaeon]
MLLESFIERLTPIDADLVLLAGDMVDKGNPGAFWEVFKWLREVFAAPIISCFGNSEWFYYRGTFKRRFPAIVWLDDEGVILNCRDAGRVALFGSLGVLGRPTRWQLKNYPSITQVYKSRINSITQFFENVESDKRILLTHYATSMKTVLGEGWEYMDELGCDLSALFESCNIDLSIHGHAHNSTVSSTKIGKTRVYNVAFPVTCGCTCIEL